MKRIFYSVALSLFGLSSGSVHAQTDNNDIQVMILGVYHFSNPGLDEHNVEVDSVLTPTRQAELDTVARALAAFTPTQIMVETVAPGPDYRVAEYERFSPEMLQQDPNEIVQIGYRIADRLGLAHVLGIDVQSAAGEEDYFPIDKVRSAAAKSGQTAILDELNEEVGGAVARFGESQRTRSIADLLLEINATDFAGGQAYYDAMLPIITGEDLAGAHLNARWYARNVAIYAKLMRNAKPGDRILVVYGAGHTPWLRHFATTFEGHRYVDPVPYLELARNLESESAQRNRR
ncbi:DUF5694 domain-containing protein [Qipengyuania sp. NPDC077563]|uniref:DUF5694 domain-containing protein n=1 Tax=Qipengyuania sp. NPDC077563 TaxID=3364497 RepID=UPI00384B1404